MNLRQSLPLACVLLASAAACSAATIVSYLDNTFTVGGTTAESSVAASLVDSGVTATSLVNEVAGSSNATFSTTYYDAYAKTGYLPTKGSDASSTPWLSFSVTVNSADTLSLTSLTFSYGGQLSTGSVSSFTPSYALYYSLDDFSTAGIQIASGSAASFSLSAGERHVTDTAGIDLTSISGLGVGQTISFRIALSANVNNNNLSYRVDDVALTGSYSAIPEPSSFALLLGAMIVGYAGLRLHRRRRTS